MLSINHNQQQSQQQHTNHEFKTGLKPSYQQSKKVGNRKLVLQQSVNNIDKFQIQQSLRNQSLTLNIKNILIFIFNKLIVIFIYFSLSNYKLIDFIFVILGVSIDFWMCKNIHGKSLVGLRWWVQLDSHTQEQQWIFQSFNTNQNTNNINYGVFWIINLAITSFWFINFIVCLFLDNTTFWISLCLYCLGLSIINVLCFYKCHGNHQTKTQQFMQRMGLKSGTDLLSRSQQMIDNPKQISNQQKNFQIQ